MSRFNAASFLLASVFLVHAAPARAQTANLAERLPADTFCYLYWHGASAISPASRDALVALWYDPGFAPARALIEENIESALQRNPKAAHLPAHEVRALLEQPIIVGARLTAPDPDEKTGAKSLVHGFMVVERAGKAGRDLISALASSDPKTAANMKITPAGFLVSAADVRTRNDLVARFSSAAAPATSLAGVAAYREAQAQSSGQPSLEFFLRFPALSELHLANSPNFNWVAFLHALHAERLHEAYGEINLDAPSELARFSIMGDTSPGSVFDVFGANTPSFDALALAPAGSSLSVTRMDLPAFAADITAALSAAMNPAQMAKFKAAIDLFVSPVMPMLGGEYAVISKPAPDNADPPTSLIAMTIHSKAANELFTSLLAAFVHPAGQEGPIVYYRTPPMPDFTAGVNPTPGQNPSGGNTPQKGGALKNSATCPYFIALTPHLLLASKDEALVRKTAHSVTSAAPLPPGLSAEPSFQAARALMPAELSGLDFADFSNARWADSLKPFSMVLEKQKDAKDAENVAAFEKWLKSGGSAVIARHLHWLMIGSWKDPNGIHWRADIN